jgi:26S proteasome regulatory subunit N6
MYKAQLDDPIVHRQLSSLSDTPMEQKVYRLIEPYSRVEITHVV